MVPFSCFNDSSLIDLIGQFGFNFQEHKFKCDHCGKSFARRSRLKNHFQRKHLQEKVAVKVELQDEGSTGAAYSLRARRK